MTHAPSMMAVAAFVWCLALDARACLIDPARRDPSRSRPGRRSARSPGLMTLIRWQNALFTLLPLCDVVVAFAGAWRALRGAIARSTSCSAAPCSRRRRRSRSCRR